MTYTITFSNITTGVKRQITEIAQSEEDARYLAEQLEMPFEQIQSITLNG